MRHFSPNELWRSERADELKIDNTPPAELATALAITGAGLERVRAFLGYPMKINSGYRCLDLNKALGGAKDSQHMKGEAADFTCPTFGPVDKIAHELEPMRFILGIDQLILEPSWIHISFTLDPRFEVLRRAGAGYLVGLS